DAEVVVLEDLVHRVGDVADDDQVVRPGRGRQRDVDLLRERVAGGQRPEHRVIDHEGVVAAEEGVLRQVRPVDPQGVARLPALVADRVIQQDDAVGQAGRLDGPVGDAQVGLVHVGDEDPGRAGVEAGGRGRDRHQLVAAGDVVVDRVDVEGGRVAAGRDGDHGGDLNPGGVAGGEVDDERLGV